MNSDAVRIIQRFVDERVDARAMREAAQFHTQKRFLPLPCSRSIQNPRIKGRKLRRGAPSPDNRADGPLYSPASR